MHGYSNAPFFWKWLIGTEEGMRMEMFTLNLLTPTYLYFLALLRTSFFIYKSSNSNNSRQRRNGYQDPRAPQGCPASPWLSVRALTPMPSQDIWRRPPEPCLCVSKVPEGENRRVQQPQTCPCSAWAQAEVRVPPWEHWGQGETRGTSSSAEYKSLGKATTTVQ